MSVYPSDQRCPRCQSYVPAGASNCPQCGYALTSANPGYPPPPPPSGNSYGTLPSPDPYGSQPTPGAGNYGGQPPTVYGGANSMNNAPTIQAPLYPPPPPPGYGNTQPDFGAPPAYPSPQPPTYPSSQPPAYPGSQPPIYASPQPQGGFGPPPTFTSSQPQGGFPGSFAPPTPSAPPARKGGNGLRIGIIILVVVVVLGAGGAAAYLLSRPKPTINVASQFSVGATPAGATGTVFNITGEKFSSSSSITFLLDGQQAPGSQLVLSDGSGNVSAKLTVTTDWTVGTHTITAKDASGYVTQSGQAVQIVDPGKANTPGPNGSPTNSASFSLDVTITSPVVGSQKETLVITGKGDSGGTVCQTHDDGNTTVTTPGTLTFSDGSTLAYTESSTYSCTGTYAAGHLTYTEMTVTDTWAFTGGPTCQATPHKAEVITGDFSDGTTISGNYGSDEVTLPNCGGTTVTINSDTGTFTGSLHS